MSGRNLRLAAVQGQPVLPFTVSSWFDAKCGGIGPKCVWLAMCYAARPRGGQPGGVCWAAVSTLARIAECDARTVRRHLRTLALGGRVEAEAVSRGRRPTYYRLVAGALQPGQNVRVEPGQNVRVEPGQNVRARTDGPTGPNPRARERGSGADDALPIDSWRAVHPDAGARENVDGRGPSLSPAQPSAAPGPERCAPDVARAKLAEIRRQLEARGLHPGRPLRSFERRTRKADRERERGKDGHQE